jgi:hypothetical protein
VSTGIEVIQTPQGERGYAVAPGLEDLLRSRRLFANVRWQEYVPDDQADRTDVDDLGTAEAASSQLAVDVDKHAILFDIDVPATLEHGVFVANGGDFSFTVPGPAWLIPSSTEGHSHLYVHVNWPWERVLEELVDFTRAGVVEEGYLQVSRKRGFTALRLPWIRKEVTSG